MTEHKDARFYIAVHEAGHAVAHWYTHTHFHDVSIRTAEDIAAGPYVDDDGCEHHVAGTLEGSAGYRCLSRIPGITPEQIAEFHAAMPGGAREARAQADNEVVHLLAGPIAEAKYKGVDFRETLQRGGKKDLKGIAAVTSDFPSEDPWTLLESAAQRVCVMLEEPGVWDATLAIARELSEHLVLTYGNVLAIAEQHTPAGSKAYHFR
jgi:hypothetical protein